MRLDTIKQQTTWNDAAGSINQNFAKLVLAIAALQNGGGGLDKAQLEEYLTTNGYTKQDWVLAQKYITLAALEGFATEDWVNQHKTEVDTAIDTLDKAIQSLSATTETHTQQIGSLNTWKDDVSKWAQFLSYDEQNEAVRVSSNFIVEKESASGGEGEGTLTDNETYIHIQSQANDTWVIWHGLNKYPSVTVADSAGTAVYGDIHYDSMQQVTITFSAPFSGKAFLN